MNRFTKHVTILLALFFIGAVSAMACEIHAKVIEGSKSKYKVGDEIVVKVTVVYTHRNCTDGIDKTKFNPVGMKILGAGKWSEVSTGLFERKLKVKITDAIKNQAVMNIVRTCNKEGGSGKLTLKVNN